jgi:hypothetical protein
MAMMPPPLYDHVPNMPVQEHVLDFRSVDAICRRHGLPALQGRTYNGCAFIIKGVCYIWRIDDASVRRHELAHCNGWIHLSQ